LSQNATDGNCYFSEEVLPWIETGITTNAAQRVATTAAVTGITWIWSDNRRRRNRRLWRGKRKNASVSDRS